MHANIGWRADRQTGRQTYLRGQIGRQEDRKAGRETDTQAGGKTDRRKDGKAERQEDRQATIRQESKKTGRQTGRQGERQTGVLSNMQLETHSCNMTGRQASDYKAKKQIRLVKV
jgi:hypothetical protein